MNTANAETKTPSDTMEAFFTRGAANEGVRFDLTLPDGTKTPHWLVLLGIDSDVYRKAQAEGNQRIMELARDPNLKAVASEKIQEETLLLLAKQVKAWSFSKPCTVENVKAFLIEAPQIRDQIDIFTARRNLFFKAGLNNS